MKRVLIIFVVLLLLMVIYWWSKDKTPKVPQVVFSGYVVNASNDPINNAKAKINGLEGFTNAEGLFAIKVDSTSNYYINIDAEGHGPVSKILTSPVFKKWMLKKATVQIFDANQDISLTDIEENCLGSLSKNMNGDYNPSASIPNVYNSEGHLIGFEMPEILKEAYEKHVIPNLCNKGVSVFIRGGSLRRNNQPVSGNVQVSVSTIDLFSRDGMPGDYSVASEVPTYMVSVGAATVEVFQDGKKLQLDEKNPATITIPVDFSVVSESDSLPERIPFLSYDEKSGKWNQQGYGVLNEEKTAYIAETGHLSTFNMDYTKVEPSCAKFCFKQLPDNQCYTLEVTIPEISGIPKIRYFDVKVGEAGGCASGIADCGTLHFLKNMPNSRPIGIRMFQGVFCNIPPSDLPLDPPPDLSALTPNLISSYVIYTGSSYVEPNCTDNAGCAGPLELVEDFSQPRISMATIPGPKIDGQVSLSWLYRLETPATSTGAVDEVDDFRIYYRMNSTCESTQGPSAGTWTLHSTIPATNNLSYFVNDLSIPSIGGGDFYEFRIATFKSNGFVDESENCVAFDITP